ncbi:MAG TPA: hypothetical protein VFM25_08020 [Verrucomicrobiae bacterium]|jgi:hypothetical protein|nr:hypothetical protein [Verrucomicrobiae bacterium]
MKELTFECPSCGQQIQCDARHAGENFPCPNCATLVRIPRDPEAAENADENQNPENPTAAAAENPFEAEPGAASYTPVKSDKISDAPLETADTVQNAAPSDSSNSAPAADANSKPQFVVNAQISEMVCVCPVCQSELRIRTDAATSEKPAPPPQPKTLTDREQQIAAGREATPIEARPIVKPRLSYILTGGERPAASENQAAQQPSKPPPHPIRTLSE